MQPVEFALFGAVVILAAGLIGYVAWPLARARRVARQERTARKTRPPRLTPAVPGKICPACHREYEAALQYCPQDARELIAANDPAARASVPGTTCPTCRRSFDGLKKFCPFDGEELVPLTLAIGSPAMQTAALASGLGNFGSFGNFGKICPICSRRFESVATFCGRDGSELVSVN
jgi:predicted amidophosphoribosyltransferase